jgi:glycosyltransferase involved in cell wall biosynthesis
VTILSLISSEGYYGVENMLVTLAQQLKQQRCRVIVGVFCNSRYPHTEVADHARQHGLEVEIIDCNGRWDFSVVGKLRAVMTKYGVDVVHPHGYKADLYALAAASGKRAALLATSHNWPSKKLSMRAYAVLDRMALRQFDKVVVVSEVVAGLLRKAGVKKENVEFIPNGVDLNRFTNAVPKLRTELGLGNAPVVGFVGRLVPDKGGALLIRAAKEVLAAFPTAKFVLAGGGPALNEWKALAGELGIEDRVIFAGAREDVPEVYASFDVAVLPSLVEALPMCLLEAMASAKPVIATNVGAIPRVVVHEQTGLLLEPGDVNALAAGIKQLLSDRELANKLASNGREHVARNFSASAMAAAYIEKYREVLVSRGQGGYKQPAWETN